MQITTLQPTCNGGDRNKGKRPSVEPALQVQTQRIYKGAIVSQSSSSENDRGVRACFSIGDLYSLSQHLSHNKFKPNHKPFILKAETKMDTWRLLPLETHNAFMNMAIDEAILTARIADRVPNTLRFYRWQPSAASIGKNQNPQDTVYTDTCRKLGVDIVRRISGGGTVYHSAEGEITYSVTAKTSDIGTGDITTVYTQIYQAITDALRLLGILADFSPGNTKNCPNLTVKGKKISGSAQTIKRGTVLQHGTLLLNADLPKMFQLLRVPSATPAQAATIATRKITSVQNELGHPVTPETATNALAQGFRATLKTHLTQGALTAYEQELAQKLTTHKYATDNWNQNAK